MAFQRILAVSNRNNAVIQSPSVQMPDGLTGMTIRVDLASPNTFNDPVNESLALTVQFSYDGGATFQDAGGGTVFGSSTGIWGRNSPNPLVGCGVPQGPPDSPSYPTHARGSCVQTGHFSFGLSIDTV